MKYVFGDAPVLPDERVDKPGWLERLLNHLDHKVIVNCDHDPYLHRWFLFRKEWLGVFIHKFVRSDEDRALHDHPWNFIVIPIWRGYIEHSEWVYNRTIEGKKHIFRFPRNLRVFPFISTRFRRSTYRHRVELIEGKPAWSMFIRFKRVREWGFWPKEGFILWNKWWQDKCE